MKRVKTTYVNDSDVRKECILGIMLAPLDIEDTSLQ